VSAFLDVFYGLFSSWEDICFLGSREEARLELQQKFKRYIPAKYINNAFDLLRKYELIHYDEHTFVNVRRRKKRLINQRVYKKTNIPNSKDILKKIDFYFSDFEKITSELTKEEDVKKLRELEKSKNVKFQDVASKWERKDGRRKCIPCNANFSDEGLLHNFPRHEVLGFIQELEDYDPLAEKQKKEIYLQKKREIDKSLSEQYDFAMSLIIKLIKDNCNKYGIDEIEIKPWKNKIYHYPTITGIIKPQKIIFTTSEIIIHGNDFELNIPINDIFFYTGSENDINGIGIHYHESCFIFKINIEFTERLNELRDIYNSAYNALIYRKVNI